MKLSVGAAVALLWEVPSVVLSAMHEAVGGASGGTTLGGGLLLPGWLELPRQRVVKSVESLVGMQPAGPRPWLRAALASGC